MKPVDWPEEWIPKHYRRMSAIGDDGGGTRTEYIMPMNTSINPKRVFLIGVGDEDLIKIQESRVILLQIYEDGRFSIDPWVEP